VQVSSLLASSLDKEYKEEERYATKSQWLIMRAYVFVNTEPGSMEDVRREIATFDGVKETHLLYGKYDILAIVETVSMKHLKELVGWRIRKMDHIQSSQTLIAS
jgi:DNA-binding Lrp family transcriptional regulator